MFKYPNAIVSILCPDIASAKRAICVFVSCLSAISHISTIVVL